MPQWLVKLAGDDIDLRSLSGQFREPECRVDKDTDGVYHLTSDTFDSMTVAAEVHTASSDMLLLINDLMKVRNPEYRPALLDKVVRINDDGTRSGYVFGSATMRGSGRATAEGIVIAPDGKVVPSPEPDKSQARLKLAEQDAKVREVLVYWRGCNAGDSDLCFNAYKVYEIIREDVAGGRDEGQGTEEIKSRGWATKVELWNFTAWANDPKISSGKARHARHKPAQRQVTELGEGDAVAFTKRLLDNWLDWKVAQIGSSSPVRSD